MDSTRILLTRQQSTILWTYHQKVEREEVVAVPAITVEDTLVLPRIPRRLSTVSIARPVAKVVAAHDAIEGAGVAIRRPFPGGLSMAEADPFLLLDHAGPTLNGPEEAKGNHSS
jgi:hypothetical protein